jgi:hypothetical protein
MDDTWASRELPVLDAVVSQVDELLPKGKFPEAIDIAAATGMEIPDVITALNALDGEHIALHRGLEPSRWHITSVTPEARRAVGQWPTGESLIERLAAGIDQAAEHEKDPEQKRRLMAVARELGGAAKTIAINVASEILEHRLPH